MPLFGIQPIIETTCRRESRGGGERKSNTEEANRGKGERETREKPHRGEKQKQER